MKFCTYSESNVVCYWQYIIRYSIFNRLVYLMSQYLYWRLTKYWPKMANSYSSGLSCLTDLIYNVVNEDHMTSRKWYNFKSIVTLYTKIDRQKTITRSFVLRQHKTLIPLTALRVWSPWQTAEPLNKVFI